MEIIAIDEPTEQEVRLYEELDALHEHYQKLAEPYIAELAKLYASKPRRMYLRLEPGEKMPEHSETMQ